MKVKVLKDFRDKYNGKTYTGGKDVIYISKARFEEIKKVDDTLVEEVKETKKAKNAAE